MGMTGALLLSPKRYIAWLQKKVDNTRGGFFRKPYLEKMVRFLDKMGKRDDAIVAMEANKNKNDELRLLYVDMLTEWKMYDHLVKFCLHTGGYKYDECIRTSIFSTWRCCQYVCTASVREWKVDFVDSRTRLDNAQTSLPLHSLLPRFLGRRPQCAWSGGR